jgi:hypothetical protein
LTADAGAVVVTRWKSEATADRYRRGMYIVIQRTIPLPFLMTFDAPDGNAFCTRRDRTNTPTQALTLLNDPQFFECAQHIGLLESKPDLAATIAGPPPGGAVQETALWTCLARVLLNTDEFLTRE